MLTAFQLFKRPQVNHEILQNNQNYSWFFIPEGFWVLLISKDTQMETNLGRSEESIRIIIAL